MSKTLLVSLFLGVATLGFVALQLKDRDLGFRFLRGSKLIESRVIHSHKNEKIYVDQFEVHEPFDQTWGAAQDELVTAGWRLSLGTSCLQKFTSKDDMTISLMRGGIDKDMNPIEGSDQTDTYVIVERKVL